MELKEKINRKLCQKCLHVVASDRDEGGNCRGSSAKGTTLMSKREISGEKLIYVAGNVCSLVILLMAFKNSCDLCDSGFEVHSFLLATLCNLSLFSTDGS